jgi:hypothetical protein
MQEELFMKYLHNLGQQIGGMFSEEAAGTVQDAFFKNLKINKTRDISVNDVISKREEKINDIRKEIQKQATGTEGMSLEDATAYAKKNRLTSIGYNAGNNVSVQGTEGQSPIFGNTSQTYPAYELQGAEFAPIIENFVKRAVGRDSNINELMKNAMTNVRNIPLAMFYGENVPISNMKDLLTYALYNKAKEYPVNIDVPGFRVTNTEKQGRVGIYYEGSGGGGSRNLTEVPKVATGSTESGRPTVLSSATMNKDGTINNANVRSLQLHYRPYKKDGKGNLIKDANGKPVPENYFTIFSNGQDGSLFIKKHYDNSKEEGGEKPYNSSSWSAAYTEAMQSVRNGYGQMKPYQYDWDKNKKAINIKNQSYADAQALGAFILTVNNNETFLPTDIKYGDANYDPVKTDVGRKAFTSLDENKQSLFNSLAFPKDNYGKTFKLEKGYWDGLKFKGNDEFTQEDDYNLSRIYDSDLKALANAVGIKDESRFTKFDKLNPTMGIYKKEKAAIISEIYSKIDIGK